MKNILAKEFYEIVTREDIENAVDFIEKNAIKLATSKRYNLQADNGKLYPYKDILRYAAKLKGFKIQEDTFYEGEANQPFERLGYTAKNKLMTITDLKDLVDKVNNALGSFCNEFVYRRKELSGAFKATALNQLFRYYKDSTDWAINEGGGTEVQYHLFFRDNEIGYGLGFNTQYVPFKNEKTPIEYMQPYIDSFVKYQSSIKKILSDYSYVIGNEDLIKNPQDKKYVLFGKKIKVSNDRADFTITNDEFDQMISDLKKQFEAYQIIFKEAKKSINHHLNKSIDVYVKECLRPDSTWINNELYKFQWSRWLNLKVDFDTQTDEEILQICLDSQKQTFGWSKGVQFIQKGAREELKKYLGIEDIKIYRAFYEGTPLEALDFTYRNNNFPTASCWMSSLCPKKIYPAAKTSLADTITDIFKPEEKLSKKGTDFLSDVQPYFEQINNELVLREDYISLLKRKLNVEVLTQLELNWACQDFLYFIEKKPELILEEENNYQMKNKDIFELYEDFLVEYRSHEINNSTIKVYVEVASYTIPRTWGNRLNTSFSDFTLTYENITKLKVIYLHKAFKGASSFGMFLDYLVDKYSPPLNQILYGPPGTGKTYRTKQLAIEIIDGKAPDNRHELIRRYEELVKNKQVRFVTFHQSTSYEDFVEGIKPETQDGNVVYDVQDGIFKELCSMARAKNSSNFEEAYNNFIVDLNENEQDYLVLHTPKGKEYRIAVNSNNNLNLYTSSEINKQGVITKSKLFKFYSGEPSYSGWEGYAKGVIGYLKDKYNLSNDYQENSNRDYVLIIDEINRGNISAIFGELITLLEEDKRSGECEEIAVTLPYSKTSFTVPSNLYIIGTMNTADRSIEALDTALRRRFSFTEVQPDAQVLESEHPIEGIISCDDGEIDLMQLLDAINKRIELLIDKDHKIGHSYFLEAEDFEDLKTVFSDKIIPLLEEYFYGDFGKIGLVLGKAFIQKADGAKKTEFADFDYEDKEALIEKPIYSYTPYNQWTTQSFISVYNNSTSGEQK